MIKVFNFDKRQLTKSSDFAANTYVCGVENGPCIIIDLGENNGEVIKYVKKHHSSCSGILLTHGHFDHIRGINNFLKEFNSTVFINEKDFDFLTDSKMNGSTQFGEKIIIESNNVYQYSDEDEINFGNGYVFKVVETPFHTEGSSCFLLEKEKALFTGDTLFRGSIGRTDLYGGDEQKVKDSLNKIKKLDKDLNVYPGHGDLTTLAYELKNNIYLLG